MMMMMMMMMTTTTTTTTTAATTTTATTTATTPTTAVATTTTARATYQDEDLSASYQLGGKSNVVLVPSRKRGQGQCGANVSMHNKISNRRINIAKPSILGRKRLNRQIQRFCIFRRR